MVLGNLMYMMTGNIRSTKLSFSAKNFILKGKNWLSTDIYDIWLLLSFRIFALASVLSSVLIYNLPEMVCCFAL